MSGEQKTQTEKTTTAFGVASESECSVLVFTKRQPTAAAKAFCPEEAVSPRDTALC